MICSSAAVRRTCTLLTCLFAVVNTLAIISPALNLTTSFTDPSSLNAIDKRFSINILYAETDLPSTPCLMNTVELLSQYAERDWLSQVRGRHGIVLPDYPQVEIAVLPAAPATTIEARLVIWGIWFTIRDIIDKKSFHEAEVDISWDGQVAAYLYFTLPGDLTIANGNGTSGSAEPLALFPDSNGTIGGILDASNTTENSSNALNEGRFTWEPIFAPMAKTLTPIEVFLTVMAGLKNAAPHVASDKVQVAYASAVDGVDANVQIYIHKRKTPRTQPPFFQYIHVIKALRLVPRYMLTKKNFAEMIFIIEVDDMPVGEGYLEKGHFIPPHLDLGDDFEPINNVSVSR